MTGLSEQTVKLADSICYHCGEAVPPGTQLDIEIAGESRPMCCPGCRAVAGLIASSGLGNFYQQRTAYNVRPESPEPAALQQYLIYDDPDLYSSFCQPEED
ncbi:MAG: heavy metal translocating P-type ATPase metal-binding domain-containing protein, partial [Gammaproteobacteria bacterium]|nr:heavy metal translocating P-type ATPase metal-binding domain-containing protein [Gammaproteobacteria bacterium]